MHARCLIRERTRPSHFGDSPKCLERKGNGRRVADRSTRIACAPRTAACREIRRQIAGSLSMTTTLAHQLANFACSLQFEDLSSAVVHEVKRRVIDSFGCALGAWKEEPCRIARKVASDFSATNGATILGTAHKAPPDWAAFATGCCIRYFDYNDTYLSKEPAHPSDNLAAVFAVAESVGATGRDAIPAAALAYEVQCRLCDAASIRARGWDHPTYGAFSTALAAARLMKLDAEKTRHAVNIAGVAGMRHSARRGWGIVALERRGLCECGPARSLLRVAGARGNDRAGADFRRTNGIRKRTRCLVRRCRSCVRQEEGSNEGRRARLR